MLSDHTLDTLPKVSAKSHLRSMQSNIVQSIRAFRVQDLQDAANALNHHFLYANLGDAQTRQEVLDMIGQQFALPMHIGKNFDSLYDSITDPIHRAGLQTGFVVVLEHIPANTKFDKEAREQLVDIFRDAAEYWGDRKVSFRCFYSFSVARSARTRHADRDGSHVAASGSAKAAEGVATVGEKLPTDKLLDISPQALRMSSPFNTSYWTP